MWLTEAKQTRQHQTEKSEFLQPGSDLPVKKTTTKNIRNLELKPLLLKLLSCEPSEQRDPFSHQGGLSLSVRSWDVWWFVNGMLDLLLPDQVWHILTALGWRAADVGLRHQSTLCFISGYFKPATRRGLLQNKAEDAVPLDWEFKFRYFKQNSLNFY